MKNIILRESTYNELRRIKDKLNEILVEEDLPTVSFSKVVLVCSKLKNNVITYHRPPYIGKGGKKSISINKQAVKILAGMKYRYESSYERMLSNDKAIYWLTTDIMSQLEIDAYTLADKIKQMPKGSVKRRDFIETKY